MTPGMIGPPKVSKPKKAAATKPKADPNEIWSAAEVEEENDPLDIDDGRKQPEYDIVFKQNPGHHHVRIQIAHVYMEHARLGAIHVRSVGRAIAKHIALLKGYTLVNHRRAQPRFPCTGHMP